MKPVVIDNFLDTFEFNALKKKIMSEEILWEYVPYIVTTEDDDNKFQFVHNFFRSTGPGPTPTLHFLHPILHKINPKEIFRIKANLLTKTPEIEVNTFHNDVADLGILPWTTSILYMNTNNGYTEFETGAKVESVENRMVVFPAEMKHRGTSCTDKKIRVVINFNYLT